MDWLDVDPSDIEQPVSPWVERALDSDDSEEYCMPSTCKPAARVAKIFDEAGVPSFLWDYWAAATIGTCNPSMTVEFVVPDESFQEAIDSLVEAGYILCTEEGCGHSRVDIGKRRPPGDAHFDKIEHKYYKGPLRLHRKSSIAWWVPDPSLEHPADDDPYFTLTNDSGLLPKKRDEKGASGPWLKLYSIKILKPVPFTEALILLNCRDFGHENGFDLRWGYLIDCMMEKRPTPDTYFKKTLRPQFHSYWEFVNSLGRNPTEQEKEQCKSMLSAIRAELIDNNELPAPPNYSWL